MDIYLVDGTYELFRHYYALPSARDKDGREVAAVRGVLASVQSMIKGGATHIAVATDHVIESFRNDLWPGYKTSEGVEPDLLAQFPLLEETLAADRCPRLLGTFVKAPEVPITTTSTTSSCGICFRRTFTMAARRHGGERELQSQRK